MWLGSRFKKKRIRFKVCLYPTHYPWCSPVLNSVNYAFISQQNLERYLGDGSNIGSLFEKAVIFATFFYCWGFLVTSFDLFSLIFSWLFCFVTTISGMSQFFLSLLRRFWLSGLFFWEITTTYFTGNHRRILIQKDVFYVIYCIRSESLRLNMHLN